MTKFKISLQAALLLLFVFSISSCEKEDPDIDNGEELITTLIYTLTPEIQTDSVVVFSFQDLDGDGGNEPVIIEGTLKANSSYTGQLTLRNEAESPIEEVNP